MYKSSRLRDEERQRKHNSLHRATYLSHELFLTLNYSITFCLQIVCDRRIMISLQFQNRRLPSNPAALRDFHFSTGPTKKKKDPTIILQAPMHRPCGAMRAAVWYVEPDLRVHQAYSAIGSRACCGSPKTGIDPPQESDQSSLPSSQEPPEPDPSPKSKKNGCSPCDNAFESERTRSSSSP
jgi:hypothetical protein